MDYKVVDAELTSIADAIRIKDTIAHIQELSTDHTPQGYMVRIFMTL